MVSELTGDKEFDKIVKTDRAVAAYGLIVALENRGLTAGEPLSHALRLQSGQLCGVRKAVNSMSQNLHAAFSRGASIVANLADRVCHLLIILGDRPQAKWFFASPDVTNRERVGWERSA
jgi:hypothetical protein